MRYTHLACAAVVATLVLPVVSASDPGDGCPNNNNVLLNPIVEHPTPAIANRVMAGVVYNAMSNNDVHTWVVTNLDGGELFLGVGGVSPEEGTNILVDLDMYSATLDPETGHVDACGGPIEPVVNLFGTRIWETPSAGHYVFSAKARSGPLILPGAPNPYVILRVV